MAIATHSAPTPSDCDHSVKPAFSSIPITCHPVTQPSTTTELPPPSSRSLQQWPQPHMHASTSRNLPRARIVMEPSQSNTFMADVRKIAKSHKTLASFNAGDIVQRVQDGESRLLTIGEHAALPNRLQGVRYRVHHKVINGINIRLLFGSRDGEIVDARAQWPAPGMTTTVPMASPDTHEPEQAPLAAQANEPPTQRNLPIITMAFFPDFHSTKSSAKASRDESREPASIESEASGDASPLNRPQSVSGHVLAERLAALLGNETSSASTSGRSTPPEASDSNVSGIFLLPPERPPRAWTSTSTPQRSSQGSVMTLSSIEDALDDGDQRIIYGTSFAKKFERMLAPHYPHLTGAMRDGRGGGGGGSVQTPDETHAQYLHRTHILTQEHVFMYATLDAVREALTSLDLDPGGMIHVQLKDIGHDIDTLMNDAFANAIRYCKASTPAYHGPVGPHYERIGRFAETNHPLEDKVGKNLAFHANETLELLHEGFNHVPGFQDIPATERWRFITDPVKIDSLPKPHHQLLAFLCDYDREYAFKMVRAIAVTMNMDRPLSLDLIRDIHTVAAAGSTAFDSRSTIADGFAEGGITYVLREGLHYADAGKGELHTFKGHIDALKQAFLQAHPDMEDAMADSRITITEIARANSLQYRRGPMPAAFLEFCIERWMADMNQVLQNGDARADDKKRAVIQFCSYCEHLHPFMDGNGRVFEILLPMRLFHGIDESLPMLDYPCKMDGHSVEELLVEFEKASARTQTLKRSTASVLASS